jgi:hypothetical protein
MPLVDRPAKRFSPFTPDLAMFGDACSEPTLMRVF